jgi:hypothetical protein
MPIGPAIPWNNLDLDFLVHSVKFQGTSTCGRNDPRKLGGPSSLHHKLDVAIQEMEKCDQLPNGFAVVGLIQEPVEL